MNTLAYRKAVWIHQLDQLGEKTIEDVAKTVLTYAGADIVLLKVFDGNSYMSRFDTAPDAISSIQKFHEVQDRGAKAGITVIPWVVPNNHTQAQTHAILAPSPVVIDLEPYAKFWMDGSANVAVYLQALRDWDVHELYVSIDPRKSARDALNVPSWVRLADGLLPQEYWTDFQQAEGSVVPPLDMQLDALADPVYPAYPYNSTAADLQAAWADAQKYKMTGCSLWRLGTASAAQLQAFKALVLPQPAPGPAPTPIPPKAFTNNDIVQCERLLLGESVNNYQPDIPAAITYLRGFTTSVAPVRLIA